MPAPKRLTRGDPFEAIRRYEQELLSDIDRTLIRVFRKGAELARQKGDIRSFEICQRYLEQLKQEKYHEQRRKHHHV